MVIEKTKVRIKDTGEIKQVNQIRLDSGEIVIIRDGKKYIYEFDTFNYIPCWGVTLDINGYDIYHQDNISFTLDGTPYTGTILWNEYAARWDIFDANDIRYGPGEVSNIEVLSNGMSDTWQEWR